MCCAHPYTPKHIVHILTHSLCTSLHTLAHPYMLTVSELTCSHTLCTSLYTHCAHPYTRSLCTSLHTVHILICSVTLTSLHTHPYMLCTHHPLKHQNLPHTQHMLPRPHTHCFTCESLTHTHTHTHADSGVAGKIKQLCPVLRAGVSEPLWTHRRSAEGRAALPLPFWALRPPS